MLAVTIITQDTTKLFSWYSVSYGKLCCMWFNPEPDIWKVVYQWFKLT